MLLSTCWGCSRATFLWPAAADTRHTPPAEGPGCSLGQAGDKGLDPAPLPARRGTSMLDTRNWILPKGQAKWQGGAGVPQLFPPGPQATLSAWNTKCKLCRAEEGFRNWDPAKPEIGNKFSWTEDGFIWFTSHWLCENQPQSLPSMERKTSTKKNERESLFDRCFEFQRSKKPKQ